MKNAVVQVRCYEGYKSAEKPVSFIFNDREYTIIEIEYKSITEDVNTRERVSKYMVRCDDSNLYLLEYNHLNLEWQASEAKR